MKYPNETVFVYDLGLFSCVAERLRKDFGRVLYFSPWEEAFVRSSAMMLGKGIDGIERVDYWEPFLRSGEVDLWVFPDTYSGHRQLMLENLGNDAINRDIGRGSKPYLPSEVVKYFEAQNQRVWGARMGEELELFREDAKRTMKSLGIPIGPWKRVTGINNLRDYLKEHENVRVKISFVRGDAETFHSQNYELIRPRLDEIENSVGPRASIMDFVVEESIDDAAEIGGDFYSVDGQFPNAGMVGFEEKSKAYIGKWMKWQDMPTQITGNLTKLSPELEEYRCRSWVALETRVTKDGKPYVVDPCMRMGNPPAAACMVMYENLPEIIREGAEGRLVQPKNRDEWACQILIHSSWSERHWQPVYWPKEIDDYVFLSNHTVIEGVHYVVPGPDLSSAVGSVVCTGKTMDEACDGAIEYAKQVEGYDLCPEIDGVEAAKSSWGKLQEYGMKGA